MEQLKENLEASLIVDEAKIEAKKIIEKAEGIAISKLNKNKGFWDRFMPADIIAILLVVGVVLSNLAQIKQQFMVPQALLLIIGFYFGGKYYHKKE